MTGSSTPGKLCITGR